jgi:uncharacterized protein (TIGR03435 family)
MHVIKFMKNRASIFAACLVFTLAQAAASGQTSQTQHASANATVPAFDITSVKPNTRNDGSWSLYNTHEGWSGMDVSLRQLMQTAYNVFEPDRIEGLPKWSDSDKFDIEGKVAEVDVGALKSFDYDQYRPLLQNLLAERFKLAVHFEDRTRPVYALIVAKSGPKFQATKPEELRPGAANGFAYISRSRPGQLTATNYTIAMLTRMLTFATGRYVQDATALTGRYDIKLDWAPDPPLTNAGHADAQTPLLPPAPAGPSIFTAVQEQLGLKLEPRTGTVPVLIIDHVEEPSPN